MGPSVQSGAPGIPSGFFGFAFSPWSLLSVRLRSALPAAAPNIADGGVGAAARLPGAAGPCFARIACAPACGSGRAIRGGAVCARDCPRARQTQDALRPCVPLGFFRAGAKRKAKRPRADAASFLRPNLAIGLEMSTVFENYFRNIKNIKRVFFLSSGGWRQTLLQTATVRAGYCAPCPPGPGAGNPAPTGPATGSRSGP